MKFKIGDKVVVKRKGSNWNLNGEMDHWLGKVMTIRKYDNSDDTYKMYEDISECDGFGWWWSEEDLELYECGPEESISIVMRDGKVIATDIISGTSVEVSDDFESGAKEALESLFAKRKEIKVGDKVKIVDSGKIYSGYWKWVADNVEDKGLIARYKYEGSPVWFDETYIVRAIAPHGGYTSTKLAYIERVILEDYPSECILIEVNGIEKV